MGKIIPIIALLRARQPIFYIEFSKQRLVGNNEMQFSDRQQIECCFFGWTLFDSIGHEWNIQAKFFENFYF